MAFENFESDTDVLGLGGKGPASNDRLHVKTDVFASGRGAYGGAGASLNTGGAGSAWTATGNFQHSPVSFAAVDATHDAHIPAHGLAAASPQDVSAGSGGQAGYGGTGGSGYSTGGNGGNASNAASGPTAGGDDSSGYATGGLAGTGTGGYGQNGGAYTGSGGGGGGAGSDGNYSTGGNGGNGGYAVSSGGGTGGGGGGAGGNGLFLKNTGYHLPYHNQDSFAGGYGGYGGQGGYDTVYKATGGGGGGGGGGNGVALVSASNSDFITFFNAGVITGGAGGAGGIGSEVYNATNSPGGSGGNGGDGGNGINAGSYSTVFNSAGGVIRGGTPGAGGMGYGAGSNGQRGHYGAGIVGGFGLYIYNGGSIYGHTNAIDFTGGNNLLVLSYAGTTGSIIGNIAVNGLLSINLGSAAGTAVTLSNAITDYDSGTGSIDKVGDGTLILTGANTYTGGTQVDAGVLKIIGAMSGDDSVIVADGAKFILDASGVHSNVDVEVESQSSSGHASVTGGYGNDTFTFRPTSGIPATFSSADFVNGNGGNDKLVLLGEYSAGVTLSSSDLKNVETVVLTAGDDYKLTAADSLLATGQSITISGSTLGSGDKLTFNGSAEKTGSFVVHGGAAADSIQTGGGNDTITGGGGADTIKAGNGTNTINGGAGADKMTGGSGKDTYVYAAASDSTSKHYDTINGFSFSHDRFNVSGQITKIDTAVSHGVSTSSFDKNIAAAASHLDAHGAILITASAGTLSGDVFLVIDQNGTAGYQAGHDLVIELHSATGTLTTSDFI